LFDLLSVKRYVVDYSFARFTLARLVYNFYWFWFKILLNFFLLGTKFWRHQHLHVSILFPVLYFGKLSLRHLKTKLS